MKITVSCVQLLPKLGDKQYNLDKMKSYVEQVMERHSKTQLIVFPEDVHMVKVQYQGPSHVEKAVFKIKA